jgi:hypothetical protein
MPGREGIEGNETADQMARLGSQCPLIRLEPTSGIAAVIAKKVGRD